MVRATAAAEQKGSFQHGLQCASRLCLCYAVFVWVAWLSGLACSCTGGCHVTAAAAVACAAGGAYPELPLLQYPLDMGRPDEQRGKQTLAVAVDIEGNANYDAILRQGARANKVIHTGHQALIPKLDLLDPQVATTSLPRDMWQGIACSMRRHTIQLAVADCSS